MSGSRLSLREQVTLDSVCSCYAYCILKVEKKMCVCEEVGSYDTAYQIVNRKADVYPHHCVVTNFIRRGIQEGRCHCMLARVLIGVVNEAFTNK